MCRQEKLGACRPRPTVFQAWLLLTLLCTLTWAADASQEGRVCWPPSSSLTLLARGALETSSGVTQDEPDPREREGTTREA